MKKALLLTMIIMVVGVVSGFTANAQKKINGTVEVVYFHGRVKCASCKAIGKLSGEVVAGLADKKVVWKEVDISTKEGEKFGDRYELYGSGLIVISGKKHVDLTEMGFKYAMGNPSKFKTELKGVIQKLKK